MKYLVYIIILSITSTGCKKQTYYNQSRTSSIETKNTSYLTEAYNQILRLQQLSELAMGEAEFKNTYVLAEETYNSTSSLIETVSNEARQRGISLDDSTTIRDEYEQELRQMASENLDKAYYELSTSQLQTLAKLSNDYLKYGESNGLKDFAEDLHRETRNLLRRFDSDSE